MRKGAIISECRKYRYQLWRVWDENKPKVLFVMHNPSKADAEQDDATIRRCIGFTKSWGAGGFYVGNLYPYRSTDPKALLKLTPSELQPYENWNHIFEMMKLTDIHLLAFGNPVVKPYLLSELLGRHWMCLKNNKAGYPSHPLFLKSNLKPKPYYL